MEEHRNLWFQNVLLMGLVALLVCAYFLMPEQKAHAAGGGWETDGVLCVSANGTERVLLIDTTKKTMCVYRTRGLGEFRLVGARSFKYDVEIDDTSGSKDVEYRGATYFEIKRIYEQSVQQR